MAKAQRSRPSKQEYVSASQLQIPNFETPFDQSLCADNRWVILARKIPWDALVHVYQNQMRNSATGADGINPRVALGAIIIKHICGFSDRETIMQIQENMYMQYFIGYSSFCNEAAFDPSVFVDLRKRLGADQINLINEKILNLYEGGQIGREPIPEPLPVEVSEKGAGKQVQAEQDTKSVENEQHAAQENAGKLTEPHSNQTKELLQAPTVDEVPQLPVGNPNDNKASGENKGQLIVDATACPQDIRYPTDLDLLSDAREKSEELIDLLFSPILHESKPRTYRAIARKQYLKTAQKRHKTKKEIRAAIRKQLGYLKRNIKNIHKLLEKHARIPLGIGPYKYLLVIQTLYDQQVTMFVTRKHSIEHRIVSIHQPHVRPIVRGKTNAPVEFGAKLHVSLMNGFAFIEDLSWEAFNESTRLMDSVERYKKRLGYYPKEVLADKVYCTRENRKKLKLLGITLHGKPLGRPKAVEEHVRPGERNPIEGKFGQAKAGYGMNRIKARLAQTSESWIASIIMVLNLVKLTGQVLFAPIQMTLSYTRKLIDIINKSNYIYELHLFVYDWN